MSDYRSYPVAEGPLKATRIKVLTGANYFSAGAVVLLRLDLGPFDEVFTNEIPGFYDRLEMTLPSLVEHHCSIGQRGGFLQRVANGTLLGHVTEHVAIELQTLAGMDVAYGKTRATATEGIYNVVFRFFDEQAGIFAAKAAVNLVNALLANAIFSVQEAIATLVSIREERMLGPSTEAIVEAAGKRDIPALRLDEYNLVQLGTGRYHKRIRATITSDTNLIGVETAASKDLAIRVLRDAGVDVPRSFRTSSADEALAFQRELAAPIVVKPNEGSLGRGVAVDLSSADAIAAAVQSAREYGDELLIQAHVPGETYRLLVIDYRFVAAALLSPPEVIGDGVKTVRELIAELNAQPERGEGDKSVLTRLAPEEVAEWIRRGLGLTLDTVPGCGASVPLQISKSLRLGAASRDVTDQVHPINRMLAERASRAMGLNVAGIDVVAPSLGEPLSVNGGAVIGVSAAPDFRPHLRPLEGAARDVATPLLNMLFPLGARSRVPLFAVTGTTGKKLTVRLLSHCLTEAGYTVGCTSSGGLYVSGALRIEGERTGFECMAMALKDPTIDCAVFEVGVESILEDGLGYTMADAGIVLNVLDEGKTFDETRLLEDVGYAKSVVAEQVFDEGYAILNADDDLVFEMIERAYGRLVLCSKVYANSRARDHASRGGRSVVIDHNLVVILDGSERIEVICVDDIPLTTAPESGGGPEGTHLEVLLGAVAALFCQGVSLDTIRRSLVTFIP